MLFSNSFAARPSFYKVIKKNCGRGFNKIGLNTTFINVIIKIVILLLKTLRVFLQYIILITLSIRDIMAMAFNKSARFF